MKSDVARSATLSSEPAIAGARRVRWVLHGMSGRQRVEVLLAFLGGYRNVTLAKGDIAPVGQRGPAGGFTPTGHKPDADKAAVSQPIDYPTFSAIHRPQAAALVGQMLHLDAGLLHQ
jgi:hypothetical protein